MAAFRIAAGFRNLALNNNPKCNKLLNIYGLKLSSKVDKLSLLNSEPIKKKKTAPVPRITLVSPDESVQICTIEDAQKISRRRDLKLVKIIDLDTKTQRPVFQLMTGAEYHAEDLKQREIRKEKKNDSYKGEKLLLINAKISEHDLELRIKNIIKWINKKHEIRVVINGDSNNMDLGENVYNAIEEKIKTESRILQKRNKGHEIKFQILPPKVTHKKEADGNL